MTLTQFHNARSEMTARHARQALVFFVGCCAINAVCLLLWGLA